MSRPFKVNVLCALMAAICWCGSAPAQGPTQEGQKPEEVLRALTNEIKLLRQSFESYARNQARFEILLQRVRVQQEHVTALSLRLDDARMELSSVRAGLPRLAEQIQNVQNQLRDSGNPGQRAELENTLKDLTGTQQQHIAREEELRRRETELSSTVQNEESRLQVFNQGLDLVFAQATQVVAQR